tara:strand:+ start:1944 stop:2222 length:279 start_codon:yes stop_codon:yes gene_type:complete
MYSTLIKERANENDLDEVYKILLEEVISKKVYFKNQNLCKYDVLHGKCRRKECCKYDHPESLFCFFTGLPTAPPKPKCLATLEWRRVKGKGA